MVMAMTQQRWKSLNTLKKRYLQKIKWERIFVYPIYWYN
jgi:hypothetical protein